MVVSSAVRSMTMSLPFLSDAISTTRCASSAASASVRVVSAVARITMTILRALTALPLEHSAASAVQAVVGDVAFHVPWHKVADGVPRRHPGAEDGAAEVEARTIQEVNTIRGWPEAILQAARIGRRAARPGGDRPLHDLEEPIRLTPGVDLGQGVGRHEQHQALVGVARQQVGRRLDRVRRPGALDLD